MSWEVLVRPKRKNDVHGVAVVVRNTTPNSWGGGEEVELSRVSIFRRPDVAAQGEKPFPEVLDDEIAKAEKAAEVMNRLDAEFADLRRQTIEEARKDIEKIFAPAKAGAPEFE